jgi:hypothetical protein
VSLFDKKKDFRKFGGTCEVKSIPKSPKIIQRGNDPNYFEIVLVKMENWTLKNSKMS